MDECILSLKFLTVPRENYVEWSDFQKEQAGKKADKHVTSQQRIKKSKRYRIGKIWEPQLVPHVQHKWHTDNCIEMDLVKAQEMGPTFYKTCSYAVVHFGDVPVECIARVVGHDENDLV